jgi:hypothetical protein
MFESMNALDAMARARDAKESRNYPRSIDARMKDGLVFPKVSAKLAFEKSKQTQIFTIGSCFARNAERSLAKLGFRIPTLDYAAPQSEWKATPNGPLNEYNPGNIGQKISDALNGNTRSEDTIVKSKDGYIDLLIGTGMIPVSLERAKQRRGEFSAVYSELSKSQICVITLGLAEAWYDKKTGDYLNSLPPLGQCKKDPDRYQFVRFDPDTAFGCLSGPLRTLTDLGTKVLITVSPVPLTVSFSGQDCVVANEYSKSVLRVCAEMLCADNPLIEYFPSYEIVRSSGFASFKDDQIHVRSEVIHHVISHMMDTYEIAGA